MALGPRLTARLERSGPLVFAAVAAAAAFATYFTMYAFRKPFAAASWSGEVFGLDLKSALVISQLSGYALSKLIGVKLNSELAPARRRLALFLIIGWAEAALVLLAIVPPAWRPLAMFLNGLPLGATWGVALSFVEGRRSSDLLGVGLSISYIVASGAVKTVGAAFLAHGVPTVWMPAVVGAAFFPLFALSAWALSLLPPPAPADVAARTARAPMDRAARRAFVRRYRVGLALLVGVYLFLTSYRDVRDNFAAEIWAGLGGGAAPEVFTLSELAVAGPVMIGAALLYRVRGRRAGLIATTLLMGAGCLLIGGGTLAFDLGLIGGMPWMIATGVGLYLAYVPYGCILLDRLIAALGVVATAVFLIYLSDAIAYGGTILIVLYKKLGQPEVSMLDFFRGLSYATSIGATVLLAASLAYFLRRAAPEAAPAVTASTDRPAG
jgi:hypothetical protein